MLAAWNQSPGLFVVLCSLPLVALVAILITYIKNRPYRHLERMRAIELNRVAVSFFSGRLLNYVPWQFWTSFAILLVLIGSALLSPLWMDHTATNVFLELAKYVTGAVIGSLFGTSKKAKSAPLPRNDEAER